MAADRVTYGCPATTPPPEVTVRLMPSRSRGNARSIRAAAGAAAIRVRARRAGTSRLIRIVSRVGANSLVDRRRGARVLPAASVECSAGLGNDDPCSGVARIGCVAGVGLDDDD